MAGILGIGELVAMVMRSGDIDSRLVGVGQRALEGQEVHRGIQSTYEEGWVKEVSFKLAVPSMDLTLQGRADGVFHRKGIHEIKSTRRNLSEWETEGESIHWAQAYCYGHILAIEEGLEEVSFILTYANLPMDEKRDLHQVKTAAWLKTFVEDLLSQYKVWHDFMTQWHSKRTASLKALAFPYGDYRPGQRKLAAAVYSAVRDHFVMMAEAPTGVGKTISTLFPTLKAMGEDLVDKIFYLTAKTVVRTVAEESLKDLRVGGAHVKSVTLTAKDKICFTGEKKCNPVDCPFAKGHFDRINSALMDALASEDHMDRPQVEAFAMKHQVCPAEFALDISSFSDVVICDYNYAFDPLSKLQRFFVEVNERYVFLVDEAHNLPHRGRDMYSAELERAHMLALRKAYPKTSEAYKAIGKLNRQMLAIEKHLEAEELPMESCTELNGKLLATMGKAFDACVVYQGDTEGFELSSEDSEHLLSLYRFNFISDYYSEGHLWIDTPQGCKMMCIDPSHALGKVYQNAIATVIFSATMAPYSYYEEVLGILECRKLVIESPFSLENRKIMLGSGVDTRLQGREKSYGPITAYIHALVTSKTANYLVFCPSYDFLRQIKDRLLDKLPDAQIVEQTTGMSEVEKVDYLAHFKEESNHTVIGLAVLGGSFSEGIDLVGDRLEGVVIVGFGTPYMSWENELIKDFYDEKQKSGYTYAYVYPAINKIVQAVGRLIRTEQDRGVILLLEDRYLQRRYTALLPRSWQIERKREPEEVYESHIEFWK